MTKVMTALALVSLAVLIGSAGALELATIGLGQAIMQMLGGLCGLGVSAKYLGR